jgi:hypothetical protein
MKKFKKIERILFALCLFAASEFVGAFDDLALNEGDFFFYSHFLSYFNN